MMARNAFQMRRAVLLLSALLLFNILFLVRLAPHPHGIPPGRLVQRDIELSPNFDGELPQNQSLFPRGNDKNEWLDPDFLSVSEEKINALPDYDKDDPWKKQKALAARKGFRLLCDMRSPTESTPASPNFKPREGKTAKDILDDYGWSNTLANPGVGDSAIIEKLSKAFEELKLIKEPAEWIASDLYHEASSKGPDGQGHYPASKGSCQSLFDLANGGLIAAYNLSPQEMNEKMNLKIPSSQLVPLQKWSDVVWVGREQASVKYKANNAGKTVKNLEHVFRYNIVTESAEDVLKMVTGQQDPRNVGLWPGVSYSIEEPQGLAVLGTVHGAGVAWMLSQHKAAMGVRAIDRVNVFNCNAANRPSWCIYLHISDVTSTS
ncbi:hypothetical protein HII31_12009 [Pseudocercospora fuligena]|uniref:Uncharacterized protein n=1 Tax=Pseudocercospora fuligena TaxID=685502 RepID=A0A8H6R794_9PEZI|nr:hypothetical protein HII31_12009 [Pseudocercospora fuligena]